MKKITKLIVTTSIIAVMSLSAIAFADVVETPADVLSGLTGKTTTTINTERSAGKTYGQMAKDADKLAEFQKQMLAQRKALLDQRVVDKTLTQAQADSIYATMQSRQATCDGNGVGNTNGRGNGRGYGMNGNGTGRGNGMMGNGLGQGNGAGCGFGGFRQ